MTSNPTQPEHPERVERVRVTGPPRRTLPRSRGGDVEDQTRLGEVYLRSLMREQLALALRTLAVLAIGVGSLPIAFHLAPGAFDVRVLGMPVVWWVLGVAVYPALILLGWHYVRAAERNERHFTDLTDQR